MTFRRHALGALLLLVALTVLGTTLVSSQLFSGFTDDVERSQLDLMQATVESKLHATEGRAASRAAMIADMPAVRRLFAARDREGLLAETRDLFARQRDQFGAPVMQFHEPPGTSFLRVHHPEQFGDDLTTYRPLVVAVMSDHAPHQGAALSRSGVSVTAIVPVLAPDGQFTGSFEVGMEFGPMLDDLDESFGMVSSLFVLEAPLREVATSMDTSALDEEHRVGSYVRLASTNAGLTHALVGPEDLAHVVEPVTYVREANGVPYGVLLYPVTTATGEPLGVIASARDFSATRAAAGRSRVWQGLLALFAIVILWGAILIVVRGMLLSPARAIGQAFAELARGERDKPIEWRARLPEELRELADQHEALRTGGIPENKDGPA